ncbi:uncharacterized protein ASCRUDRAFT_118219 [Ascoidea rubescens DSM 1968]|uniref:Uncharacterized protein n=1 Tax=Ascoidea rubescens DSM 1968 TaxID=1344418 RepID=A0A1D2VAI9_9ASCO|nr:hypothetical protein ASCRUDRAFT_118219 [Ascoidea rubescens DSM 1968]ODV58692.1 hypothetical protein ASCRUDRAFT_118219 [Ascoidea rubescens DSM 1968]
MVVQRKRRKTGRQSSFMYQTRIKRDSRRSRNRTEERSVGSNTKSAQAGKRKSCVGSSVIGV